MSARWVVLGSLYGMLLLGSLLVPEWIAWLAGPEPVWFGQPAGGATSTLQQAWLLERSGSFEEAVDKYRLAQQSTSPDAVRLLSARGAARVTARLLWPAQIWRDLKLLNTVLLAIRLPLLVAGFLFLIARLLRRWLPNRGLTVDRLPVYGSPNLRINRYLRKELAGEIERRHQEHIHTLTARMDLTWREDDNESQPLGNRLSKAMEDFKPQQAVGFALNEILRGVAPPRYRFSGALWLTGRQPGFRGELRGDRGERTLIDIPLETPGGMEVREPKKAVEILAPRIAHALWEALARSREDAMFLEGWSHFVHTDYAAAAGSFQRIKESLQQKNEAALAQLRKLYASGWQLRWIVRRLPKPARQWLLPWLQEFRRNLDLIHGGNWFQASQTWTLLKEARQDVDASSRSTVREFDQFTYNTLIDTMRKHDPELTKLVDRWLQGGDEERTKAAKSLDYWLDEHDLWMFDASLNQLEFLLLEIDIESALSGVRDKAPVNWLAKAKPIIEKARAQRHGAAFDSALTAIEQAFVHKDWPGARKAIGDLREFVRSPSEFEFQRSILALHVPRWRRWLIESLFPAFRWSRHWKNRLRDPLFLEARIYDAWARLHLGTLEDIQTAGEDMEEMRRHLEIVEDPSPRDKAVLALAAAIQATAASRWKQNREESSRRTTFHLGLLDSELVTIIDKCPPNVLTAPEKAFLEEARAAVAAPD